MMLLQQGTSAHIVTKLRSYEATKLRSYEATQKNSTN